jgi:uncharacterized membrane protein YcaP (DUF421 family)
MGKRQIGEMEPFELVITLIIADLATIPMADPTIPIWFGILPLLLIAVLHCIITLLQNANPKLRDFISGRPVVIVTPEGVDKEKLKSLNITMQELTEMLRNAGVYDVADLDYAIIERNGKLTTIDKGEVEELPA